MSNMVLWGTNKLPWPRGFPIDVALDAFLKFLKSGALRMPLKEVYVFLKFLKSSALRGHLKEVDGGPRGNQVSNMVIWGVNELLWPRGFQIGVTLDAFLKFLKSGALRGHCQGPLKGGPGGPLRKGVNH